MDLLYELLLYIHILSVIASVGPFFILTPIVGRLRTAGQDAQAAYLEAFRFAVRLAKHAGHVLVGSGILLVLKGSWSWGTPWIVMTLLILAGSLFFLARAFSPTLRSFHEPGTNRELAVRKLSRAIWIYLALLLLMLGFMVYRPTPW